MYKSFIFGFIAGLVLLVASAVVGFQPKQKSYDQQQKEQERVLFNKEVVDATPTQLGVMTERQRAHSKLYTRYQQDPSKNISQLIAHPIGRVIGLEYGVGLGPKLLPDTPENYFEKLAKTSDAIIRGKAKSKVSQITEDDTFIFTDYDVVVLEVLKNNSTSPLAAGATITVTRPGGKIVVNDVIVYTKDHEFLSLPIDGKDLILFLKFIPETGAYQTELANGSFAVEGEALEPLTGAGFPPGVLQDGSSFLQTIRALSK